MTGETIGTEYGIKDRSINTLTSGRMNIFEQDMEIFGEYFPLGTGVHISTLKRAERENIPEPVASHVELSRLLAEHGILGLIFLITTFSWFIRSYKEQMTGLGKYFVVFCFIFSIGTTFHSATRTFITPLMGGLAMIRIAPDRKRTSSEL